MNAPQKKNTPDKRADIMPSQFQSPLKRVSLHDYSTKPFGILDLKKN